MCTEKLCPICNTGADAFRLDEREPMCPYLSCHNGETCSMYAPLEKAEEQADK